MATVAAAAGSSQASLQQAVALFSGPKSEELRKQSCNGVCSSSTPKVSQEDLDAYMREGLPGWRLTQPSHQRSVTKLPMLTRKFVAKNFLAAVHFFNDVAKVAEEMGHHPDLHLTNFREVEINVSTHAVGGITLYDLVLAAKLDALEVDYSPKWLKQQQAVGGGAGASGGAGAAQ